MPISRNEETGVKPLAWQFSIDNAGVPIKKRRFIRPASPPPEEQSSPAEQLGSLSQESAPANANGAASIFGKSEVNKNIVLEENKIGPESTAETKTNNLSRVNIEEQSLVIQSGSLPERGDGVNGAVAEKSANVLANNLSGANIEEQSFVIQSGSLPVLGDGVNDAVAEKSANVLSNSSKAELNLSPDKASAFTVGKEMNGEKIVEGKCKSETSTLSGNLDLSLGLKEQSISALEDHRCDGSGQNQVNVESISLNLSLSKGESSTQGKDNDSQLTIDSADIHANRSNWDLNTTMDAWESSASDAAAGKVIDDGLNIAGVAHDMMSFIPSTKNVGTGITIEKRLHQEGDHACNFTSTFPESHQQNNSDDSLHLHLIPSFLSFSSNQDPTTSSANKDTCKVVPSVDSSRGLLGGSSNLVNSRTIKREPFDESHKFDFMAGKGNPMGSLDFKAVKRELVGHESLKLLNFSALNVVHPGFVKPEPLHDSTLGTEKTIEGTSCQSGQQGQDTRGHPACSKHTNELQGQDTQGHMLQGLDNETRSSCSKQICTSSNMPDNLESSSGPEMPNEASENAGQVASEMNSLPVGDNSNEANVSGTVDTAVTEDKNVGTPGQCTQKLTGEPSLGSCRNDEGRVSDEEKINLSGDVLEEVSYGSEYESDGNSVPMDIEEDDRERDDYEDGEVREQQLHTAVGGPFCESKEDISHGVCENQTVDFVKFPCDDQPNSSQSKEKDTERENPVETNKDSAKECIHSPDDQNNIDAIKDLSKKESSVVEMPAGVAGMQTNAADKMKATKTDNRKSVDLWENKDVLEEDQQSEKSFDQVSNGAPNQASNGCDQMSVTVTAQSSDTNVKINDAEKNDSVLPEVDPSLNCVDATNNANSRGNRSRVINLSGVSNMSSPGQTRSITGKLMASHHGRERLADESLEGDKLHPRGRDGIYNGGPHKFSKERHQDQSSRLNFNPSRRVSSRIDTVHGDRDSERDFAPEFYNGQPNFSGPRHKFASGATEAGGKYINYNFRQDGAFLGNIHGGRKLLDDETSMFRNLTSRRRSPGGRDGPAAHGLQMVRRVTRNIGEEGLRHGEKIMRGFPDDGAVHAFTRPQPPCDGLDGHFVQGTRNFSSVNRRAPPQLRSKSPTRSRSPGPWSSSRRRSPDGYGGPPELAFRRSPPIYRLERMRSPDHPGFPGEMMVRRHGSPSYLSRPSNLREMDPGRDHGHPRSIITNRSPNGRVLLRNNRRFGVMDPRDRTGGDEFFGGPIHSGRFHELGGDINGEDRRRFGERRGLVHPFRPPFNGGDGENFNLNTEDVPRNFRFLPEDEQGFPERPNLREREFDRRIKNRPLNPPRRPRGIEEQERNYRHGGQVIYEDGFDDMSRLKRKRF